MCNCLKTHLVDNFTYNLNVKTLQRNMLTILILLCMVTNVFCRSPTRIKVTTPVNPVKQGDIFSLHCQIWNLKPGNEVAIFKNQSGTNVRLSVNTVLTPAVDGDDEGTFLAVRLLNDGSVVYFLSIVNVVLTDAGMYTCKVIDTSNTLSEVAVASKVLQIMHHPDDDYPKCTLDQSVTTVTAGTKIGMTCQTTETFPLVDIKWSRTGLGHVPLPKEKTQNGELISQIEFVPTEEDDGSTMFLCEITSTAFPEFIKTCHIGPLKVLPGAPGQRYPDDDVWLRTTIPKVNSPEADMAQPPVDDNINSEKLNCPKTDCSTMSPDILFWVISTAVAGIICFIFLIGCILIYLKYTRLSARARRYEQPKPFPRPPTEYIYTELEGKREGKYMSLERPKGLQILPVECGTS